MSKRICFYQDLLCSDLYEICLISFNKNITWYGNQKCLNDKSSNYKYIMYELICIPQGSHVQNQKSSLRKLFRLKNHEKISNQKIPKEFRENSIFSRYFLLKVISLFFSNQIFACSSYWYMQSCKTDRWCICGNVEQNRNLWKVTSIGRNWSRKWSTYWVIFC